MDICRIEDCGKSVYANELCRLHYWIENEQAYVEANPRRYLSVDPLDYKAIGKTLGVSKERVRQLTKASEREHSFSNEEARKFVLENYDHKTVRASLGIQNAKNVEGKRIPNPEIIALGLGEAMFFPSKEPKRFRNLTMEKLPAGMFRSFTDTEGIWILRIRESKDSE